jgi:hypothetical protein
MERLQHLSRMSYRDTGPIMFTKVGIIDLHTATHERLDFLLRHVATVPDDLCHNRFRDSATRPCGSNWCTS